MPLYPGDSTPSIRRLSSIADGEGLTSSEVTLGCHLGTHVDAPAHFVENGKCVDELGLHHFWGQAVVIEIAGRDEITVEDLRKAEIAEGRHILIKTRNSELLRLGSFDPNYCTVSPEAAKRLLEFQPLSIGFDYYSLDPPSGNNFPSHMAVARRGIPAFLCLDLKSVAPGEYWFVALPPRLHGVEAFPVRAMLFRAAPS